MNIIISEGLYESEFVEKNVEKFDELKNLVAEYTPGKVSAITGVPEQTLKEAARTYAKDRTRRSSTPWGSPSTSTERTMSRPWPTLPCSAECSKTRNRRQPAEGTEQCPGRL
jgi:hypothetical protein